MKIKEILTKFATRFKLPLAILAVIFLVEDFVLVYDNLQSKTPILGLKLKNHQVGSFSRPQIEAFVKNQTDNRPLRFSQDGKIIEIRKEDLGATVDPKIEAQKLLQFARQGSILKRVLLQNKAAFGLVSLKLKGDISESQATLKLLELQTQFNRDSKPPMPDFQGNLKTLPAKEGIKLDTNKLVVLLDDNIFDPPQDPIPLPSVKTYSAPHAQEEIDEIAKLSQKLSTQPLSIRSGGLVFTLSTQDLKNMQTVVERPDPKNPKKVALNLRLDDVKLNQKLGDFAQKVENITHAEFDDHDARVAIYAQFQSGSRKTIDIPTGRNLATRKILGETTGQKTVYLTFDDGPNSVYHPLILDILKAENVKATFFLVGRNSQKDIDIAKRTKSDGHEVGNHSLTHSFLPNLSSDAIVKELSATDDILKVINGEDVKLFRPPYGGVNFKVKKTSDDLGLKLVLWDVDPRDWSEPPEDELVRRVTSATKNGSDILLHSNHLVTAKALPKIIQTLRSQGYTFKTLD